MAKRLFDVIFAALGLVALSPLFVLIAWLVRLSSPGPILHRATRAGRQGNPFTLLKFRTMLVQPGPAITRKGDARVTAIGRFLRRTKLDELPQLINVIVGDMSIVGPRPEDPIYVALYTDRERAVLEVRPGITSPASILFCDEESQLASDDWETAYRTRILPQKLSIDLDYLRHRSLLTDIGVILRTFGSFVR